MKCVLFGRQQMFRNWRCVVSDYLVTRLREPNFNSDLDLFCIMEDAADEIERLRKMLAELRERYSAQETKHYRIIKELETQLKAARGE